MYAESVHQSEEATGCLASSKTIPNRALCPDDLHQISPMLHIGITYCFSIRMNTRERMGHVTPRGNEYPSSRHWESNVTQNLQQSKRQATTCRVTGNYYLTRMYWAMIRSGRRFSQIEIWKEQFTRRLYKDPQDLHAAKASCKAQGKGYCGARR